MTSQARIAANRGNARKSRGPRTAAGKFKASRNALRHGLSAVTRVNPALEPRIDAIATKLCGGDENPLLREQALIIAENHVVLARVRAARLDAIERRLRDGGGRGDSGDPQQRERAQYRLAVDRVLGEAGPRPRPRRGQQLSNHPG